MDPPPPWPPLPPAPPQPPQAPAPPDPVERRPLPPPPPPCPGLPLSPALPLPGRHALGEQLPCEAVAMFAVGTGASPPFCPAPPVAHDRALIPPAPAPASEYPGVPGPGEGMFIGPPPAPPEVCDWS